jgi:hypothetical protein
MLNAAIQTARSFTGQVGRNRLLSLSGRDRRHAQRRTANGGADQRILVAAWSTRSRRPAMHSKTPFAGHRRRHAGLA